MFYSDRFGLLYVACTKTGSMSVHATLAELDPEGERFSISLPDRVVDLKSIAGDSLGHATASELRRAIGDENYQTITVFVEGCRRHRIDIVAA